MRTKVVHSLTKNAWNVVGDKPGARFKVARVPYIITNNDIVDTLDKAEALKIALFISDALIKFDL